MALLFTDYRIGEGTFGEVAEERSYASAPSASTMPLLRKRHVHVWCSAVKPETTNINRHWQNLSSEEQARADRFHFKSDRDKFIISRGVLRTILSGYTHIEPDRLEFVYNAYGKPGLPQSSNRAGLRFNLSNSHELALLGVAAEGREIGVDLEYKRPSGLADFLPQNCFSARELASLRGLPVERLSEAFFHCWTRKEAYLKAIGKGFGADPEQYEVAIASNKVPASQTTQSASPESKNWIFGELALGPDYAGAMVVQRS